MTERINLGSSKPRRSTILLGMGCAVVGTVMGFTLTPSYDSRHQTAQERTIANDVDAVYHTKGINVECVNLKKLAAVAKRDMSNMAGIEGLYVGSGTIVLHNTVCDIYTSIPQDVPHEGDFTESPSKDPSRKALVDNYLFATHIVAHEGGHAAKGANETEAECDAAQTIPDFLAAEGMPSAIENEAAPHVVDFMQEKQKGYAAEYAFTSGCHPGGPQDITGRPSEYFPFKS